MEIMSKEIALVDIDRIIPNPKNPNKHSEKQIERLAKIFRHQGFREPLTISNQSGFLVCGHGRLDAAKALGVEKLPVMMQDFENEALEYAHMTADNEIARWAEFDEESFRDNWSESIDPELYGLDKFDFSPPTIPGEKDDEIPETEENEYGVKEGDLWELGNHRLLCGDSTLKENVDRLMNEEKADMVFTDPPYGINFQSNFKKKKFDKIKNDNKILNISELIFDSMEENSPAYICTRWDLYPIWFDQFGKFNIKNCIVWVKGGGGLGDLKNSYSPNHEFIIVAHKGVAPLLGKRERDSWEIGKDDVNSYKHPTQKPVALSQFAIKNHGKSKILDLFLGSGSTLIACEKTNRKCYGMELDPHYCSVIIKRWEDFTGQKARRV